MTVEEWEDKNLELQEELASERAWSKRLVIERDAARFTVEQYVTAVRQLADQMDAMAYSNEANPEPNRHLRHAIAVEYRHMARQVRQLLNTAPTTTLDKRSPIA